MAAAVRTCVLLFALAGCSGNPDSQMWDCQLSVQKGNAGRSADDKEERNRDIEACMRSRGYRLDSARPACRTGVTTASCYRPIQ